MASFDNTGLVLVIGVFFEKDQKFDSKLEFHSVDITGIKGKFQSLFLEETLELKEMTLEGDKISCLF